MGHSAMARILAAGLLLIIFIGCDEQRIVAPVIGAASGSGASGGEDARRVVLFVSPSHELIATPEETAMANIIAQVKNSSGHPAPDGTTVVWQATVGTLNAVTTLTSKGTTTVTITFSKSSTACSQVSARAGDASDAMTICVRTVSPTPTPIVTPTVAPVFSCTPKKTCSEMRSCEEAMYHLTVCGNTALDHNHNNIPCEQPDYPHGCPTSP